jgi:hypothetical protein
MTHIRGGYNNWRQVRVLSAQQHTVHAAGAQLEEGSLRPRSHAREVRVFPVRRPRYDYLLCLALGTAGLFLFLLGLLGPLASAFRESRFS